MKTIPRSLPRFTLASLCGLLFVAPSFVDGANMVVNGGFEDGAMTILSGFGGVAAGGGVTDLKEGDLSLSWDKGGSQLVNALSSNGDAYFNVAGGGPRSGALAAVLPSNPTFDGYISQAILGVVAGQVYNISFWVSNQIGDIPLNSLNVNWGGTYTNSVSPITGGVSLSGFPAAISVPTGWTYYSFNVTAPTNDARLSFIGGSYSAGILIDDVSVEASGVPDNGGSFALLGIALAGLALFQRKEKRAALA